MPDVFAQIPGNVFASPTEGCIHSGLQHQQPAGIENDRSFRLLIPGVPSEQNGCPLKFFEAIPKNGANGDAYRFEPGAFSLRKKVPYDLFSTERLSRHSPPENCVLPAKQSSKSRSIEKQSDTCCLQPFDNLLLRHFFDELSTHYNDEMRAHRAGALVKTPPRKEPEQYVFELDASKTENALANGSFELGTKGWHLYSDLERGIEKCRIEGDSPHGKYKMRLEGEKVIFQHYPIFVRKAGDFTISFMARELEEKSSIKLRLRRLNTFASPRNTYHKNFDALGKEFQHYSVSGNLPPDAKGIFLEFEIHGKVELDMMQLHGGEEARTT